jgi:hypothetical protein
LSAPNHGIEPPENHHTLGADAGVSAVLPGDTGVNRNHQQVWMAPGGGVHLLWRIGDTSSDPAGSMSSADYGATWDRARSR